MGLKIAGMLVPFLLIVSGCATLTVKSDYDKQSNLGEYRTFAFLPRDYANLRPATSMAINPLALKRIKRAIERELSERGYRKVDRPMADFVIAYHAGVKEEVDIHSYGYGYRHHWKMAGSRRYNEGTLVVDFVDKNENELFWRGWAQGAVGNSRTSEEEINRAVGRIIEKFPPRKRG